MKSNSKKWIFSDFDDEKSSHKRTSKDVVVSKSIRSVNLLKLLQPRKTEDLAVHSKKIKELEDWLQKSVSNERSFTPILVLSGPTGCGKTTAVTVLCKTLGISISEWINPMDQDYEFSRCSGQVAKLSEFLSESKYPTLFESCDKKITLIEDFPNALINNPAEFVGVLEKCYQACLNPAVFICTDASSSNLNMMQTLFPQEVLERFSITHISFNQCPPTLLRKVLVNAQAVVQKNLDALKMPTKDTMEAIIMSSMGDIRCAVNQYNFAVLKGMSEIPTELVEPNKANPGTKRKRSSGSSTLKSMTKDESLGLFHSLGRVLNPKRKETNNGWRLQCALDPLIDELSTQPSTFVAFLFENYPKYFGNLDDAANVADILSVSEIMLKQWSENRESLLFGLWVAVTGTMVYNEHKVSRWTQITGPKRISKVSKTNVNDSYLAATDGFYYDLINRSSCFYKFKVNKT